MTDHTSAVPHIIHDSMQLVVSRGDLCILLVDENAVTSPCDRCSLNSEADCLYEKDDHRCNDSGVYWREIDLIQLANYMAGRAVPIRHASVGDTVSEKLLVGAEHDVAQAASKFGVKLKLDRIGDRLVFRPV